MKEPFPTPPANAPPGTVWFGGPIGWFSISLLVTADDLDPDDITRALGVEPDAAQRKGVALANGRVPRFGRWAIRLQREQTDEWDVVVAIGLLLDRIPACAQGWQRVRSLGRPYIFVGLHLDSSNRGLDLPSGLMWRLGGAGIDLGLDIYADDDRETGV